MCIRDSLRGWGIVDDIAHSRSLGKRLYGDTTHNCYCVPHNRHCVGAIPEAQSEMPADHAQVMVSPVRMFDMCCKNRLSRTPAAKHRVERIAAGAGDEQQHDATGHRDVLPEVAILVGLLRLRVIQ